MSILHRRTAKTMRAINITHPLSSYLVYATRNIIWMTNVDYHVLDKMDTIKQNRYIILNNTSNSLYL